MEKLEERIVHLPLADKSCCVTLERQIALWYEGNQENTTMLMNSVIAQLRNEGTILAPVVFSNAFLQGISQAKSEAELQQMNEQIGLQSVQDEHGVWYVAFTSEEQAKEDGNDTSTMPFFLRQLMEIANQTEDCLGLLLNPWGQSISIPKNGIQMLLEQAPPMTSAEKTLRTAERAYQNGDYDTAVPLLEQAIKDNQSKAFGLLGECYYYGRGTGKDKGKARGIWEMGAKNEDANSAGKLADMYRNGDLEPNEGFANALYHRAFDLAKKTKALDCYPDACLRMLKYCKADFSEDDYENLAWDAVEGFRERVAQGDVTAEKLLNSAQSYLDYIEQKKAFYKPGKLE